MDVYLGAPTVIPSGDRGKSRRGLNVDPGELDTDLIGFSRRGLTFFVSGLCRYRRSEFQVVLGIWVGGFGKTGVQ